MVTVCINPNHCINGCLVSFTLYWEHILTFLWISCNLKGVRQQLGHWGSSAVWILTYLAALLTTVSYVVTGIPPVSIFSSECLTQWVTRALQRRRMQTLCSRKWFAPLEPTRMIRLSMFSAATTPAVSLGLELSTLTRSVYNKTGKALARRKWRVVGTSQPRRLTSPAWPGYVKDGGFLWL